MKKIPEQGMHGKYRGLWPNRERNLPCSKDEIKLGVEKQQMLLQSISEKTSQIGELMKIKSAEQIDLHNKLESLFQKRGGADARKALARTKTALEDHLNRTMRELDARKSEMKKICRELDLIRSQERKCKSVSQ